MPKGDTYKHRFKATLPALCFDRVSSEGEMVSSGDKA